MSDANYTSLAFARETTWGTPATPPLKIARITGESLEHKKDVVTSEEVRSDRQTSDLVEVGMSAAGAVDFELSYLAWQEFLEAALFSNVVDIAAVGITADFALAGQTITASTGTPFAAVLPGCFVKVAGAANALNNGPKLVISKTDTVLTLAAGSIAANQAAATITVTGKHLKNGNVRHSYTGERNILTSANLRKYQRYYGLMLDKLNLTFESKKIVVGKMEFVGKVGDAADTSLQPYAAQTLTLTGNAVADETVTIGARVYTWKAAAVAANQVKVGSDAADSILNLIAAVNAGAGAGTLYGTGTLPHELGTLAGGAGTTAIFTASNFGTAGNGIATTDTMTNATWGNTTTLGGVSYTPANTDPVVNATSNLGSLRKDGVAIGDRFKKLELAINNNLRGKDAIGEKGNFDVGVGEFSLTGSLSAYFKDNALLSDFIAHGYTGLSYVVTNGNGQRIGVHIPRLNFSTGGPMVAGKNTDLMQDMKFTAILSETYGATLLLSFLD